MAYTKGDFEVICPACGTWHLAPESNDSVSTSPDDSISPEDLYIPEEPQGGFSNDKNTLPDELTQEEAKQEKPKAAQYSVGQLIDHRGHTFPLVEGKNIIGRKNADVVIDDKTVSRKHCVIEVSQVDEGNYHYHICDIGFVEGTASTNGVFVSGRSQRLQDYEKLPLSVGSTFKIGETSLKIKLA
jgi:pSer/pThr/pTyr-binding forkhead associated (FHA) protein